MDSCGNTSGDEPSRLLHLDALRGLMLVFMAVNHIPSDLQIATNHIFGFVSAAEGFVFLAGLLAGMIYTRRLRRESFGQVRDACVRRAAIVYGYHLAAYFTIFAWVVAFTWETGIAPACSPALMQYSPWLALLAGPFFIYQPGLLDVLPMYCLFMLVLPFLLRWLELGYRSRVMFVSFGLWALSNALIPRHPLVSGIINTGAFNPVSWQLLFVIGAVFGHAWGRGEKLLPAPRPWLIALVLLPAGLLWATRHAFLDSPWSYAWLDALTNKNNLAPLRLINVALVFYLVHLALARFPSLIQWRPLALLGRHSLPVFAGHIVIASMLLAFPALFSETVGSRWISTTILLGGMFAVAGLHQVAARRQHLPQPLLPTRQPWTLRAIVRHGKHALGVANPVHR